MITNSVIDWRTQKKQKKKKEWFGIIWNHSIHVIKCITKYVEDSVNHWQLFGEMCAHAHTRTHTHFLYTVEILPVYLVPSFIPLFLKTRMWFILKIALSLQPPAFPLPGPGASRERYCAPGRGPEAGIPPCGRGWGRRLAEAHGEGRRLGTLSFPFPLCVCKPRSEGAASVTVPLCGGKENKAAGGLRGLHCVGREGEGCGNRGDSTEEGPHPALLRGWLPARGRMLRPLWGRESRAGDRTRIVWGCPPPLNPTIAL